MSDIVEQLEDARRFDGDYAHLQGEAAREIRTLRIQLKEALKRESATTERYDARIAEVQAENARLREALNDIGRQKLDEEMNVEELRAADFQEGYDGCVRRAREALKETK